MPFDTKAFGKTQFQPREAELTLPALAAFFPEGEPPVFRVRGLNAVEIHQAKEDGLSGKLLMEVIGKLAAGSDREKAQAVLDSLGLRQDDPPKLAQMYNHLEIALVEPRLERSAIVKLGVAFPIELQMINNKIMELTGKGAVAHVKP